jgi:hypothetical protein
MIIHNLIAGQATIPVMKAVAAAAKIPALESHTMIFGLDANVYEPKPSLDMKKWQSVVEFGEAYVKEGLTSCYGDVPDPTFYTTFTARTFLQPQLNKACRSEEKRECGDVNPKVWQRSEEVLLFPFFWHILFHEWAATWSVKNCMLKC